MHTSLESAKDLIAICMGAGAAFVDRFLKLMVSSSLYYSSFFPFRQSI